ncbi:hypothetical protein Dimus_016390 [Dionaea muscipula]
MCDICYNCSKLGHDRRVCAQLVEIRVPPDRGFTEAEVQRFSVYKTWVEMMNKRHRCRSRFSPIQRRRSEMEVQKTYWMDNYALVADQAMTRDGGRGGGRGTALAATGKSGTSSRPETAAK